MNIEEIKALAAAGATEVTVYPDGRIVAKFDKPAAPAPTFVPYPYPVYPPLYPPLYPQSWVFPFTWLGSTDNKTGLADPNVSITLSNVPGVFDPSACEWVDPT